MAHNTEPMDIDDIESDFDNKENSLHHSNVLPRTPCTEKGYEELDVSELNMKLRYSITPASSPMSKSYTGNLLDNRNLDPGNDINTFESNLTRSFNSIMTKPVNMSKPFKLHPRQVHLTEPSLDNNRNPSVLRELDTTITSSDNNINVTITRSADIDENLSLPSSSSSLHTPEATTPTNDVPKPDGGSPIMRGLKSVLNMFRSSQSPIPPIEGDDTPSKRDILSPTDITPSDTTSEPQVASASTPIAANRNKDGSSSKRSSPLKESIVFNEDLEKELLWKDETTILFSQEKIPIHKLFYQQSKPLKNLSSNKLDDINTHNQAYKEQDANLNSTVEYMDISQNDSIMKNKSVSSLVDSDNEFVDCETTFINNETELLNDKETSNSQDKINSSTLNVIDHVPVQNVTQVINKEVDITKKNDLTESKISIETPSVDIICKDTQLFTAHDVKESDNINNTLNKNEENTIKNQLSMPPEPKLNNATELNLSDGVLSQNNENFIINTNKTNIEITKECLNSTVVMDSADRSITSIIIAHDTVPSETTDEIHLESMSEAISSEKVLNESEKVNVSEISTNIRKLTEQIITDEIKPKTSSDNVLYDNNVTNKTDVQIISHNDGCRKSQSIKTCVLEENMNKPQDSISVDNTSLPIDIPLPDEDFETEDFLTEKSLVENTSTIHSQTLHDVTNDLNTSLKIENAINVDKVPMNSTSEVISPANFITNTLCENENKEQTNLVQLNDDNNKTEEKVMAQVSFPNSEIVSEKPAICELMMQADLQDHGELSTTEVIKIKVEQSLTETSLSQNDIIGCLNVSIQNQILKEVPNVEHSNIVLQDMNSPHTIKSETDILDQSNDFCKFTVNSDILEIDQGIKNIRSENYHENVSPQANFQQNVNVSESNATNTDCATNNISVNNNISIHDHELLAQDKVHEKVETPELNKDINLSIAPEHLISTEDVSVDEHSTNIVEAPISPFAELTEEKTKEFIKQDLTDEMQVELSEENSVIGKELKNIKNEIFPSTPVQIKNINKTKTKIDGNIDEEITVSENNSPYVLVSVDQELEIENTSEDKVDDFENIENPFTTESELLFSPPSSPKIISKGYDLNFDEIDDPFATKSNIRLSPPLESPKQPIKTCVQKAVLPKREIDIKDRRKSQTERKKETMSKKNFNSTFDGSGTSTYKNQDVLKENSVDIKEDIVDVGLNIKTENTFDSKQVIDVEIEGNNPIDKSELENNVDNFPKDSIGEIEDKSVEISSIPTEIKDTSSSEQSVYFSAATSSGESVMSKNVFNIPEIDDKNFNPFVTKSKMRQSPPPDCKMNESCHYENITSSENKSIDDKQMSTIPNATSVALSSSNNKLVSSFEEGENDINVNDTTCSSKTTDDKNVTVREVHTDDDDTIEGPFLEPENIDKDKVPFLEAENIDKDKVPFLEAENIDKDKVSDFVCDNSDMIQFNELPPQANDDLEAGELFIDADAFEFLLNQNKSNTIADSGKESLFLKFDPLFAKRMSSDGVLAALNKIQKRQSTPKKMLKTISVDPPTAETPVAGPSTFNVSQEANRSVTTDDSVEDVNVTISKPMMVVTPAVNPVVTPRKSTTPTSSNRRSITFTSPAIAVIDRLLSLSANNSLTDHDNNVTQVRREQNEADLALTQLRELLAEKEINVYNLRTESKELKNRLSNLESQMRTLESESEERLKKVNELTEKLSEKTKLNRSMAAVVEEYERTIASLIAETEQDKKLHNDERMKLIKERDEQTAHLASMEVSFSDLHSKYEKSKQIILTCKANEETYKKSIKEFEENLTKMQNNYELLKQHATSKLNHANQELEKMNRAHEADVVKLNAMIKRKELHITSLEETLAQKTKANEELTAICDELINKVG